MGHDIVPLAGIFMILALSLGIPLVRSYTKRMEGRPHAAALPSGEVITRLDRIEQAIEAMATEVERIAEGQRFTTKLLSSDNRATPTPQSIAAATVPRNREEPAPAADGTILTPAARR